MIHTNVLYQGHPTFFDPRAILAYQKYWQTKQIKHPNFCPKIIVISKKKGLQFESFSIF